MTRKRPYLVAYDIRWPKRLYRVHKVAKRYGIPIQYSVFWAHLTDSAVEALIGELRAEIDSRFDDIRIYPIPTPAEVVLLGEQVIPDGIYLDVEHMQSFLEAALASAAGGKATTEDVDAE